ncbi:hypothetical protein ABIA96_007087 [Bradyrhizobium sp. LB11.1]|jgi:hypothetical protein
MSGKSHSARREWKNHRAAHKAIMRRTFGIDLYVMVSGLLGLLGASYGIWIVLSQAYS